MAPRKSVESLPGTAQRPATLDDLAALNREMAALVRAGLPLEEGLAQIAAEFGGGTSQLAAQLARETTAGHSLEEAIVAQGDSLPPVYRAVVIAGLRSGRLPAALEGFADTAARVGELRRIAAQAGVYPLMVIGMAWALLVTVTALALPRYEWLELGRGIWAAPLAVSRDVAWKVALVGPIALAVIGMIWWRQTATAIGSLAQRRWLRWIPGARRATQLSSQACFAELLALFASCQLPLDEALPLAGEASGDAELRQAAAELGAQLAAGGPLPQQHDAVRRLPPLVRSALVGSASHAGMVAGLTKAAKIYRDRAVAWVGRMAIVTPVATTLVLGGVIVVAYAALMLQPYAATLYEAATWY